MPIRLVDLDSGFTLPYSPKLYLGRGVNILEGKPANQSPFKRSSIALQPLSQVASTASFTYSFIRDKKDLDRSVDASIEASAGFSGVPVTGGAKYVSKLQISDTHMATLLTASFEPEAQLLARTPVFTAEADALLARDPEAFARQYGDYFVAGFTCRSTMTAVASHSASSKSNLDSFALHVQAGIDANADEPKTVEYEPLDDAAEPEGEEGELKDDETADKKPIKGLHPTSLEKNKSTASTLLSKVAPPSGKASTSVSNLTRTDGVTTKVEIHRTGVNGVPGVAYSIDEVLKIYDDWSQHIAPTPVIVHLEHYKTIDSRAVSPGENLLLGSSSTVSKTMKRLYRLFNDVCGSDYAEIRDRRSKVTTLMDDLADLKPIEDGYAASLDALVKRVTDEEFEVNRMRIRRRFIARLNALSDSDRGHGHGWQARSTTHDGTDHYGFTPESGIFKEADFQFILGEIKHEEAGYAESASSTANENVLRVRAEDAYFIGFTVYDNWRDGSNGGFEIQHVDNKNIHVRVKSKLWQGCNWGLRGWRVPSGLYPL